MFDIEARVTESPDYKGIVGAFIADDALYMIVFLAATPYYYNMLLDDAEALIKSGTLISAPAEE
jgi:hypothetical protein